MSNDKIFSSIHDMAPSSAPYGFGRRVRNRIFVRGLFREVRVLAKSLIQARHENRRLLIVCRSRSGSKLLTRLLDSHSRIHCDREVFNRNVLAPVAYFDHLAGRTTAEAYGAKLLSEHMVLTQRMHRPDKFLEQMVAAGVTLIHLERGTLMQTISGAVAHKRGQLHSDRGGKSLKQKVHLDPQDFVKRLQWSKALLEYEKAALQHVSHLHISYERNLIGSEAQNETVSRICELLGLPAEEVAEPLQKLLPHDPQDIIENYDDIRQIVAENDLAHLLPEASGN